MGKLGIRRRQLKTWSRTDFANLDLHVDRGRRWLDKNHPIWFLKIDAGKLDMAHLEHCILGQLYGSFGNALRDEVITPRQAVRGGFIILQRRRGLDLYFPETNYYQQLTEKWRGVLESRKDMHRMCRVEPPLRRKGFS